MADSRQYGGYGSGGGYGQQQQQASVGGVGRPQPPGVLGTRSPGPGMIPQDMYQQQRQQQIPGVVGPGGMMLGQQGGYGAAPSSVGAQGRPGSGLDGRIGGVDMFNALNPSSFPVLGGATSSATIAPGSQRFASVVGGGMGGYGMDGNAPSNFSILNEDFPALPTSGRSTSSGNLVGQQDSGMDGGRTVIGSNSSGARSGAIAPVGGRNNAQSSQQQQQASAAAGSGSASTLFSLRSGPSGGGSGGAFQAPPALEGASDGAKAVSSSAGSAMPKESRYGLLGLLDVIKMTDRDLNTLALGSDLTTFGLNLSSADSLHLTFSSPFSDVIAPAEAPVFITPPCYMMQPPNMKPDHLSKMNIETLFYIFYSMPRDQLQTASALELYRREWWFHVDLRLWMKLRAPPAASDPAAAQAAGQQQFVYFDSSTWEARIYTGPALRAGGFLSEEEISMTPKPQQQQGAAGSAQGLSGLPGTSSGGAALGAGPGNFAR